MSSPVVRSRRQALRLLPALPALALGSALAQPRAGAPLRVITLHLPPYGMLGPDGQAAGICPELTTLLAQETGLTLIPVLAPYPRAMAMMASGEGDLIFSTPNQLLDGFTRPLAKVFSGEVVLIGRAGLRLERLEDLHGKVVGRLRGAQYLPAFDNDKAIRKHETITYQQSVQMLLEGRLDAIVGFRDAIFYAMRALAKSRALLGAPLPLVGRDISLCMSRHAAHQEAGAALARAMNALRERGAVKAVTERYFAGLPSA